MKIYVRFLLCLTVAACLGSSNAFAGNLSADLSISKDNGVATSTPGTQTTYTIVASNAGPSDAAGTTIVDTFPAELTCTWTCAASAGSSCTANGSGDINDVVTILVGGNATYTAECQIDPAASGNLSNTATVTTDASVTDTNQANNSATDTDTLSSSADLSISKTDNTTQQAAGSPIVYTIVASNNGPSAVSDAVVTDNFPAPLQNCSWTSTASGGASGNTSASGNINDTLDMPAGSSVTYTATCDTPPTALGTVSNTATISSATATDPTGGNNSGTDGNTVLVRAFAIPALGPLSLLAMIGLLGLIGFVSLGRRLG